MSPRNRSIRRRSIVWPAVLTTALAQASRAQVSPLSFEEPAARFFWADADGDGLEDAYVIAPTGEGRLLENRGDGTLEDVTPAAGLADVRLPRFAAWEDFDGDGDQDLFVGVHAGASRLFANEGAAGFVDVTSSAGLGALGAARHAGFLDYDADGLSDLHVGALEESLLFHNLGGGLFERVALPLSGSAESAGVAAPGAELGQPALGPEAPVPVDRTPSGSAAPGLANPGGPSSGRTAVGGAPLAGATAAGRPADAQPLLVCADAIKDQDGAGCLQASTRPTLGRLFPISQQLFISSTSGFVGMNDQTPTTRLDVTDTSSTPVSVVRADGSSGPTRGYLAAQGKVDFDGVTSADWSGREIGVAGISTGSASSDNYGLMGHSTGVAVRGENAGNPALDFAELGLAGIGLRASGATAAGEFLGHVAVRGGKELFTTNPAGQATIKLTGDNTGRGDGNIFVANQNGSPRIFLDGGFDDDGGDVTVTAADGSHSVFIDGQGSFGGGQVSVRNDGGIGTIELRGDGGTGGVIELLNETGVETMELDSDAGGDGSLLVRNQAGATRVWLDGGIDDNGGDITLYAADGTDTLVLDGEGTNAGGEASLANDTGETTLELIGANGYASGEIHLVDRFGTLNQPTVQLHARGNTTSTESGGVLTLRTQTGTDTVVLDGDNGATGGLAIFEQSGSIALEFVNDALTLFDHAGSPTITYNRVSGAKSGVVDTPSYGPRLLYCVESPEIWFEDFGGGQLRGGVAEVKLDRVFRETVTIDEAHPLRVYVTVLGDCQGVYIEKHADRFVVRELGGGTSSASFDWRAVAKRKGTESLRLEPFDAKARGASAAARGSSSR